MKKLLFTLMFLFCIPITATPDMSATWGNDPVEKQYIANMISETTAERNKDAPPKIIFDLFKFTLAAGLVLLILVSPIIIWFIMYAKAPEGSTMKTIMDIATVIFAILSLGLIFLGRHKGR